MKEDPNAKCQKCLQKGHWTSDCKNERVYTSRPTRTTLLKNPSLRLPEQIKGKTELEELEKLEKERDQAAAEILAQSEAFNRPEPGVAPTYDEEEEDEDSLSSTTDEEELQPGERHVYGKVDREYRFKDPRPRSRSPPKQAPSRRSPQEDGSSSGYTSDSE